MTKRRDFIVAGAGVLVSSLPGCGGGGGGATAAPPAVPPAPPVAPPEPPPPEIPAPTPAPTPPANLAPAWSENFAGTALAVGESFDLRPFVADPNGDSVTFTLNAASSPITGILTLTSAGIVTRIGAGDVTGVLIDADDGR